MIYFLSKKKKHKLKTICTTPNKTNTWKNKVYLKHIRSCPIEPIIYYTNVQLKWKTYVSYHEQPILTLIGLLGEFWHLLGPNGSGKSTFLLNKRRNTKGYGQDLYLFGVKRKWRKHLGYKKNIGYFSTAMTDLFQKMIASNKWFYLFFDSIGLYTQPISQKKIVSQWLKLV
jgi:molybdate transport system ATP-binding protein